MPNKENNAELRRRAVEIAREKGTLLPETLETMSSEEILKIVQELQVHQIELEMQNDELRRIQTKLDASRERYFDLYDLAPVGYCTVSEEGIILEANLTAALLLGVKRGKLVDNPVTMFISKDDQDIYYQLIRQLFSTGRPQICELRFQKNNGGSTWGRLDATLVHNFDKQPHVGDFTGATAIRIILSDISVSKKIDDALQQSNALLKYRNTELDAFNYSISHDLRGPLNIISMFTTLLGRDYSEMYDEDGKLYLCHITTSVVRMVQILDDMQKLTQISLTEINSTKVNLSEMLRSVAAELKLHDSQREVEFIIDDNISVFADLGLMKIVIENLTRNAWKFTSKEPKAQIRFSSQVKDGHIVCCIRDNGVGFDMKFAGKLFMPFRRLHTEEEFPGTGIGLALIRRIINRLAGKVWAEGEVGKGAAFYFELPNHE